MAKIISLKTWRKHWLFVLIGLIVFGVIGTLGASKLEERDSFCTSCHLAPEVTYVERTSSARMAEDVFNIPDLASFHYWDNPDFRCVDCHRGDDSLAHRGRVLLLAASDTITFLTGRADETLEKGNVPAVNPNELPWHGPEMYNRAPDILNAACEKCHQETLTLVGFENHFHNKLPAARVAFEATGELLFPQDWPQSLPEDMTDSDLIQPEETVLTCLDCHRAHVQGFEFDFFLQEQAVVLPACTQCHVETGKGPQDLAGGR
ncbi:MAG: hypothetical protein D6706_22230 [Chloroflexi bacterium]|nr:MAG: hypothetical protein D6706_22230 [Chloroflexota bacterium]